MKKNILINLFLIVLLSCTFPEKFEGIDWDSEFKVPLIKKTFYCEDLKTNDNINIVDEQLLFCYESDLNSNNTIDENLKLKSKETPLLPIIKDKEIIYSLVIDESLDNDEQLSDIDVFWAKISNISKPLNFKINSFEGLNSLNIHFYDIYSPNGKKLDILITDFSKVTSYDLTNHYLGSEDNEAVLDSIRFSISCEGTGSQDYLGDLKIWFDDFLCFSSFKGKLYNKELEISDVTKKIDIDYPQNIGNVFNFKDVSLNFKIVNEIGFNVKFYGKFKAVNENTGESKSIYIDAKDNLIFEAAPSPGLSKTTSRTISDSIATILNIYPTKIIMSQAKFVIGENIDNDELGFAGAGQSVEGFANVKAPFKFTILTDEEVSPDSIYSVEISQENQDFIEDYLQDVQLILNVKNSLPLGANIDLYMDSDKDKIFDISTGLLFVNNYVSSGSNFNNDYSESNINLEISKEQLDLFFNDEIFIGIKLRFDSSNGEVVEVYPRDNIIITGNIRTKFAIDVEGV